MAAAAKFEGRVLFNVVTTTGHPDFEPAFAIYGESFPPGEVEGRREFRSWLRADDHRESPSHDLMITARRGGRVVGMATIQYIEALGAAFLGYLVVAREARGAGVGSSLARRAFQEVLRAHRAVRRGRPLGAFGELEHLHGRSRFHRRRLRFWARLGMRPLQIAWRYPRLEPGTRPSAMYLAFKPMRPGQVPLTRERMSSIVRGIYAEIYPQPRARKVLRRVLLSIEKGPARIDFRDMPEEAR
ncbi:MAG: GNAT family N-acetyltransferase [Candidatus Eisenbacteria bacterium]|nr:GNAT family N-acetyltransferase [Candidatus Eisenbacteria bacterium]